MLIACQTNTKVNKKGNSNLADARKAVQAALTLADTNQERIAAQRLLSTLPK